MDYVLIYRPYNAKKLVEDATKRGESYGEDQAKDLMGAINDYAAKGYTVKNNGCIVSGDYIIFWALMERV